MRYGDKVWFSLVILAALVDIAVIGAVVYLFAR
jgi:hypothetical protein